MNSFPMRAERKPFVWGRVIMAVLGAIIGVAGALVMLVGYADIVNCRHFRSYPAATATILATDVTTHHGSKGSTLYRVECSYSYQVDGVTRRGDRIYFKPVNTGSRADADRIAATYPVGAQVPVFYNPAHPDDCLLDPRITPELAGKMAAGSGLAAIGLGLVLFPASWRRFFSPDLPINTEQVGDLYVIYPSAGWRATALLMSTCGALVALLVVLLGVSRTSEPSVRLLAGTCLAVAIFPALLRIVYALITDRTSGALLIDPAHDSVKCLPVRSGGAKLPLDIRASDIIGLSLKFSWSREARSPNRANAKFCLVVTTLLPEGNARNNRLKAFVFQRDDAHELVSWLRALLQLPPEDPESFGTVKEVLI